MTATPTTAASTTRASTTTTPTTTAQVIELAGRVHVYEQAPGGWCVNNAGIVVDGRGALVIDTAATETRAKRLRDAVDGLASGPRRVVVNTHAHGDHTFGNHVFGPATTVIAHEDCRTDMDRHGLALTGLWPGTDWGEIELVLPDITVTDGLTLRYGSEAAEVVHVGPAHTEGDLVVWLPGPRILFAGDVLFSQVTPFHLFGSVRGTLAAIERLRDLGPRTVVCGHGPVAGPDVLEENASYLRWILRLAESGTAAGETPLEVAGGADLGRYGQWIDTERIVGNLHRAYLEMDDATPGGPIDYADVLADMVAYNDGEPACLA
ncbi:MBL fold metallo-hydrolase [Actinomadura graeca]|uniref:MBL fold metallo-hydrolase n=1 Tax=Actinomadura graeca TaxID=2750812 RepID=A0ABX8QXQ3_9ACTN|nr:MBL fold metallo-hydrolase [Actinomadura graeca]QXJ23403.1 MBL fold metallo-hydrolase [Actinomadura graeca]